MIKNHKFLSLFAITLCAALLLSMNSRATRVFALADPVQSIAPVYDTQIYQLQDYIEHGGLSSGQLDIFYTLAGFYVLGQAGSSGYKLVDPYANSDSVWDWLKSCGIEIYNTVIGLVPDTARMPITGDIYSTIPFKKASQLYVATLMGAAVKAATFSSYQDFKNEVINSESYWLPWNLDVQKGMNSIFGIYGGVYDWQFNSIPFESTAVWLHMTPSLTSTYWTYVNNLPVPHVRCNLSFGGADYNNSVYLGSDFFTTYCNLFLNTSLGKYYLVSNNGDIFDGSVIVQRAYLSNNINSPSNTPLTLNAASSSSPNNNIPSADNYLQAVQKIYNFSNGTTVLSSNQLFYEDFVQHVYVGTNWLNKTEIFNLADLNFTDSDQGFYDAVPDTTDYLIDIKGILQDILNNTDLFNVFINNLVDINGVPVHDDDLIRITTSIYDLLEQTNPVMPVNLNDISDYTENTYLDLVKQHGENFGETIGQYVAFWHNSDPEITYVIFGALILTLIGAFVGKWGHS